MSVGEAMKTKSSPGACMNSISQIVRITVIIFVKRKREMKQRITVLARGIQQGGCWTGTNAFFCIVFGNQQLY